MIRPAHVERPSHRQRAARRFRGVMASVIIGASLVAAPGKASAVAVGDPVDVHAPYDVARLSVTRLYDRWPHVAEHLRGFAYSVSFRDAARRVVDAADFRLRFFIDVSGNRHADIVVSARAREGELSPMKLTDLRTGARRTWGSHAGRDDTIGFLLDIDDLHATRRMHVWASITDGTTNGTDRVPDDGSLVVWIPGV